MSNDERVGTQVKRVCVCVGARTFLSEAGKEVVESRLSSEGKTCFSHGQGEYEMYPGDNDGSNFSYKY